MQKKCTRQSHMERHHRILSGGGGFFACQGTKRTPHSSYDCVDRIVLNSHFALCYSAGGFRFW